MHNPSGEEVTEIAMGSGGARIRKAEKRLGQPWTESVGRYSITLIIVMDT